MIFNSVKYLVSFLPRTWFTPAVNTEWYKYVFYIRAVFFITVSYEIYITLYKNKSSGEKQSQLPAAPHIFLAPPDKTECLLRSLLYA